MGPVREGGAEVTDLSEALQVRAALITFIRYNMDAVSDTTLKQVGLDEMDELAADIADELIRSGWVTSAPEATVTL